MPVTAIVGAGIAGLLAAHQLRAAGHEVVLLDKGHRPGGRLASRRVGAATFDTGAQFLTVRDPEVASHLDAWREAGVVRTWFHGSPDQLDTTDGAGAEDTPRSPADGSQGGDGSQGADRAQGGDDGHPRYRGHPTMRAIAEHLAAPLPLHLGVRVTDLRVEAGRWRLTTTVRDGAEPVPGPVTADALLLTPPLPQTRELVTAAGLPLAATTRDLLDHAELDPCIAVLAVPDGPVRLPARGCLRLADGPVSWLTDNHASGASTVPAVTVHGSAGFSRDRWDDPDTEVAAELLAAAREHLGTTARAVHVHRWRYAAPTGRAEVPAVRDDTPGAPLLLAGDGLTGGRVEGAAVSGLAAARLLRTG